MDADQPSEWPMTPRAGMTRAEALAEARRRWGKGGDVAYVEEDENDPSLYYVGHEDSNCMKAKGWGPTWEAAFADADRRAGREGGGPSEQRGTVLR